jgi:hypothetical protein
MARIRTVKPGFWKHEALSELPEATHMLACALLNYADDDGYFNANPKLVKAECCPLREPSVSIQDSLNQLSNIGWLRLGIGSDGRRYGHIVTFAEHQVINRKTESKIKDLKIDWENSVSAHAQLTEPSHLEGNKEGKGKGKDIRAVADATRPRKNLEFEEFWKAYPRRQGANPKHPARKKFEAFVKSGISAETIISAAKSYAADERKLNHVGTPYVAQAVTWLNQQRFEDYQPKNGGGTGPPPGMTPEEKAAWARDQMMLEQGDVENEKGKNGSGDSGGSLLEAGDGFCAAHH